MSRGCYNDIVFGNLIKVNVQANTFASQRANRMKYAFLVDSYETERIKVVSIWSEFRDEDLPVRPNANDARGRSVLEHMVHQCVSEDTWFRNMLGIDVGARPLPLVESRIEFIRQYASDSAQRLDALRATEDSWWEELTTFFDTTRSRAWVMTRRLTHTAHHRGQQMAMLRMLGREVHSNYGPTADTGGLMQMQAPTIYAYQGIDDLLDGEARGGAKATLPGTGGRAITERPS
jgi:uncharacterized damage-inducible protein DinB